MAKKTSKTTSAKLGSLAAKIMKGYEPTRKEIESLAACVLVQREVQKEVAAKASAAPEAVAPEADAAAPEAVEAVMEAAVEPVEEMVEETTPKKNWLTGLFGKK